MMLYLMRHGLAEDASAGGSDDARRLTPGGREKIRLAAQGLHALKIEPETILTSPLPRAAETAQVVADQFGGAPAPQPLLELATATTPGAVLTALKRMPAPASALIVGHEPTLSRVASMMIAGSAQAAGIRLKQGGVIALELTIWIEPGKGKLCWMLTQRHLRKLS